MPILQHSEGATVNGGTFVDVTGSSNVINIGPNPSEYFPPNVARIDACLCICKGNGKGIKLLLNSIQREAIHDSDARGDLGCHPDTREDYIHDITSWGRRQSETEKRACLMTGPAGAGKSAIARTCAYRLKATGNLGASFFFYRPSRWNDPKKFIPTIAYQLATRYSAYRDCIDVVILDDPLVLEKAMDIQFLELFVKPLLQPSVNGHNIETDLVIVVDGLDECATVDAQLQIIDLIATSIHERTTPFLWAFFSRPEPPITSAFSAEIATNITWKPSLTLSGNANSDIETYLRGSFKVIRAKYNIPTNVAWPAEEDVYRLVSQSAGLFVYAATAIRYIDGLGNGRVGLEERLEAVSQMDSPTTESPFSALDQLYKLLMMQIPEGVLSDTMALLHLDQSASYQKFRIYDYSRSRKLPKVISYCLALGLSSAAFHVAIGNLYSVLEVSGPEGGEPESFQFYHRSFLDFLLDVTRSERYFIGSAGVHRRCLEMVVRVLSNKASEYPNLLFSSTAY
jgi:hypothetical protein